MIELPAAASMVAAAVQVHGQLEFRSPLIDLDVGIALEGQAGPHLVPRQCHTSVLAVELHAIDCDVCLGEDRARVDR